MNATRFFAVALAALFVTVPLTEARDAREQARIDFLIAGLGSLPGAVFIRNGTDYKASEAQSHLRKKLDYVGNRIATAEDFIRYCASESSVSHRPYQIRFSDGRTVKTATYFGDQLKKFDAQHH